MPFNRYRIDYEKAGMAFSQCVYAESAEVAGNIMQRSLLSGESVTGVTLVNDPQRHIGSDGAPIAPTTPIID